jgi:hypothetical protein
MIMLDAALYSKEAERRSADHDVACRAAFRKGCQRHPAATIPVRRGIRYDWGMTKKIGIFLEG